MCLLEGRWGLIPKVQGADPVAGCSGSVLGTGTALAACPMPCHPTTQNGMENGCGAAWGALAVAATAMHPSAQGIRRPH